MDPTDNPQNLFPPSPEPSSPASPAPAGEGITESVPIVPDGTLSPPLPDPPLTELADYEIFLRQDVHNGTVYFRATHLMDLLSDRYQALRQHDFRFEDYLEDVHRNALKTFTRKITDSSRSELARTDHEQLTSLVKCILPVAKEVSLPVYALLKQATKQGEQLTITARRLWTEHKRAKERGNVKFVDKLSVQLNVGR